MRMRYIDLVEQTFDFPQEEFAVKDNNLLFHNLNLKQLLDQYGTPLKITYLPKITSQIERARRLFHEAMESVQYNGNYHYCYCTKASHFAFVLKEALKNNVHIETSSAYDIDILMELRKQGLLSPKTEVICNGYKDELYIDRIAHLLHVGHQPVIPVIDNVGELARLEAKVKRPLDLGIRIASEEDPKFQFYTSRLGIGYRDIVPFYREVLHDHDLYKVKLLHFFINTGITDTAYYWNELTKCVRVYCRLKRVCPELNILDIGGGLPVKSSLNFDYDYSYMVSEIINQIKTMCAEEGVPEPEIYTEFGNFTVGESGATFFSIIDVKQQNDRERWYMIDSSFMTNLPDAWAINKRFIMLPINNWERKYRRVLLGGLTCDSDDYYASEQHCNAVYLPDIDRGEKQYIGFFNTGAYQDALGGFGGLQHCLIPNPAHLLIDLDARGEPVVTQFAEKQDAGSMLNLLGYK